MEWNLHVKPQQAGNLFQFASNLFVPNLKGLWADAVEDWKEPTLESVLEHSGETATSSLKDRCVIHCIKYFTIQRWRSNIWADIQKVESVGQALKPRWNPEHKTIVDIALQAWHTKGLKHLQNKTNNTRHVEAVKTKSSQRYFLNNRQIVYVEQKGK